MEQLVFKGVISVDKYQANYSAIFIGESVQPIAELLEEEIAGKQVSVRYWLSDVKKTKNKLKQGLLNSLFGSIHSKYNDQYSACTGYLWTDEELNIGGHNLMDELRSNVGKYIWLEIDIHGS